MEVTISPQTVSNVTITSTPTDITICPVNALITIDTGVGPPGVAGPGRKRAVSGSAHAIYGQLTMSGGNTIATIPGSGVVNQTNMSVKTNGQDQTDFTYNAGLRRIILNFTPTLTDNNRMIVDYEET